MDDKTRQDIALFRISVLGPLVGARLEHGDVLEYCREAAGRDWEFPDGTIGRIAAETIRGWHYAYQRGGLQALLPADRSDLGTTDIRPDLADLVLRAKRERPRRTVRRIIAMLVWAGRARPGELSKSAVHRLLARHRISHRPRVGPSAERRSFLCEFPGDLLVGDALHPRQKVILPDGSLRRAYLLSQIDCATRYVPESYFALHEDAPDQERGLKRVLRLHGCWRSYFVDHGPAYTAGSLRIICAELGMRLIHAGKRDPEAKGVIEAWHRTWRAEVESELPDHPIPLSELQAKHNAWLSCDYHARLHTTTGRAPREHWLALCEHVRPLPAGLDLDALFLHRASRKVSKVGTVRWDGCRLEVSPELCGQKVELRFDPNQRDLLPKVYVDRRFVCDTVPLDLYRNAQRLRRRNLGRPDPAVEPTGLDPLADLVRRHQRQDAPLDHLAEKETADEDDETSRPRPNAYRSRFGLGHNLLPRDAAGKSFFDQTKGYLQLEMYFQELLDEPGLGVLTAEPGVGKTAAIRNLCAALPEPDYRVLYNCDTAVSPFDLYRVLALDLGLRPSHRRAQLWADLKRAITHLVEEQHTQPVLVLDEAQQLSDRFLADLSGFLNYAFDRKTLLTVWLVGLPTLETRLRMQHHAPLASRVVGRVRLEPLAREDFKALIQHATTAAGSKDKLLTDSALEILWRGSRGVPRAASKLLRAALRQAHHENQNLVDDRVLTKVIDELTPKQEDKP